LLHLGPGFANGLANLHNAARAHVPLLNIVGDHATYHRSHDAPLTADIEALARPYSVWLRTSTSAANLAQDGAEAVVATRRGGIATLIVPADAAWSEGSGGARLPAAPAPSAPDAAAVERAAALLRNGLPTAILLGGRAAQGRALEAAGRIAAASGARLLAPFSFTRLERGAGRPCVERIAYVVDAAVEQLREVCQLILVEAAAPVAFFAYPGKPGLIAPPDCVVETLAGVGDDAGAALEALAECLPQRPFDPQKAERPGAATGALTLPGLAAVVGAVLPEGAIVVDESLTSGRGMLAATAGAPPHDWLVNTGGSIGIGTPLAAGAALACPGRPILCLSGDGCLMYTLQALWTAARENLAITTVVFANRAYNILKGEMAAIGAGQSPLLDIGRPDLDFVALARGMGVPAVRVIDLEAFRKALQSGLDSGRPNVIEVPL
jgi:acetolactate synthase-1/2/3 large subunit